MKTECGVSKKNRIVDYLTRHTYEDDVQISKDLGININDVNLIMDEIFGD